MRVLKGYASYMLALCLLSSCAHDPMRGSYYENHQLRELAEQRLAMQGIAWEKASEELRMQTVMEIRLDYHAREQRRQREWLDRMAKAFPPPQPVNPVKETEEEFFFKRWR